MGTFADAPDKVAMDTEQIKMTAKWMESLDNFPQEVERISKIIATAPRLRRLDFIDIGPGELHEFVWSALRNPLVEYLVVESCAVHEPTFKNIDTNTSVKILCVGNCTIRGNGDKVMIGALKANKGITKLCMFNTVFRSEEDSDAFCEMLLTKKDTLLLFYFGYRNYYHCTDERKPPDTPLKVLSVLRQFTKLKTLELKFNNYGDGHYERIVDMLKTNRSITHLVLKAFRGTVDHWTLKKIYSHNKSLVDITHNSHIAHNFTSIGRKLNVSHADVEERLKEESRGPPTNLYYGNAHGNKINIIHDKEKVDYDTNRHMRNTDLLRRGPCEGKSSSMLVHLTLINCNIRSKTPFPSFPNLKTLDLSDNRLLHAFDISRFPALEWLKLSRCDFHTFSHSAKTSLKVLFIDFNPIQSVPNLLNLEEVYCVGCPFADIVPVIDPGVDFSRRQGRLGAQAIEAECLRALLDMIAIEVGLY